MLIGIGVLPQNFQSRYVDSTGIKELVYFRKCFNGKEKYERLIWIMFIERGSFHIKDNLPCNLLVKHMYGSY